MFRFGRQKATRFAGLGVMVLLGAVLSQHVFAEDLATPTGSEFRTFAVEDLDLRPPQGNSNAVGAGTLTTIPGYPLSREELSLVLDSSAKVQGFNQPSAGAAFADEQGKPTFHVRVVTWIKQRSSDFSLFRLFDADSAGPGLHVDVDTDEEELMLKYRVGF